jgi:hypothetical protein
MASRPVVELLRKGITRAIPGLKAERQIRGSIRRIDGFIITLGLKTVFNCRSDKPELQDGHDMGRASPDRDPSRSPSSEKYSIRGHS